MKTASGSVIVYYFDGDRAGADLVDPATGLTIGAYELSGFIQFVTNLHRSFLMDDAGRAAAGIGALAMVVLAISGAMMLAARLGGWTVILRPIRGTASQRLHAELGRFAVLGLILSALTGCYMSLATFGVLPDGTISKSSVPTEVNGGPRAPVGQLAALKAVDLTDLRELTFPYARDLTDVYALTTAQGIGYVDAATGEMLAYLPHSLSRQVYETIYMLHTGQGLWPLALILGLAALTVPVLSTAGALIWWTRRSALPRIRQNVRAQSADTIILVGSEGNSTWGFAVTLHAALTKAGHRVHTAPMNRLAPAYARAARMLILTATYGDGAAPASANHFLTRLGGVKSPLPVAVLGFGDRSFPRFCQFAEDVAGALGTKGWPMLLKLKLIDRQSAQDFAQWGTDLGGAIGTELTLNHIAKRPKTVALELIERVDYGAEVQAPTAIYALLRPRRPSASGGGCAHPACRSLKRAIWLASCRRAAICRGFIRLRPPAAMACLRSACANIRAACVRVFCTSSNPAAGSRRSSARTRIPPRPRQGAADPDRGRHRDWAACGLHPTQHQPTPRAPLLGWAQPRVRFSLPGQIDEVSRRPAADASEDGLLARPRRRICAGSDCVGRERAARSDPTRRTGAGLRRARHGCRCGARAGSDHRADRSRSTDAEIPRAVH